GITDSEGSFNIEYNKSKKSVNLAFVFTFHIDELPMLLELQKILQCGKIYLDNENYSCRFYIRNLSIINQLMIPIFQEFPLNTSKQLNCIDFSNVAKMLTNKLHLTDEGLTQILNIKSQMNNNREDLSKLAYRPIKITWPWLLGFLEGDGSFSVSGT